MVISSNSFKVLRALRTRALPTLLRRFWSSWGCSFCTSPSCRAAAFRVNAVEPVSRSKKSRSSLQRNKTKTSARKLPFRFGEIQNSIYLVAIDLRRQISVTWREFYQNNLPIWTCFSFPPFWHMRDVDMKKGTMGNMVAALALDFSRAKFADAKTANQIFFFHFLLAVFFLLSQNWHIFSIYSPKIYSAEDFQYNELSLWNLKMTFNGFGTQTAWPDGTDFAAGDGEVSKGGTSIRDLSQGMSNCVRKLNLIL